MFSVGGCLFCWSGTGENVLLDAFIPFSIIRRKRNRLARQYSVILQECVKTNANETY